MNLVVHQPFFAAFFFHHFSFKPRSGFGRKWVNNAQSKHCENLTVYFSVTRFPSMNHSKFTAIFSQQCVYLLLTPLSPKRNFTWKAFARRKFDRCFRCRVSRRTAKILAPRAELRRREKPVEEVFCFLWHRIAHVWVENKSSAALGFSRWSSSTWRWRLGFDFNHRWIKIPTYSRMPRINLRRHQGKTQNGNRGLQAYGMTKNLCFVCYQGQWRYLFWKF